MNPSPEQIAELTNAAHLQYFNDGTMSIASEPVDAYTAGYLRRCTDQATEIAALKDDLQFVERWAVHHGTKPHMTPENALSAIQHYPAITAITKSYADGKVPDTFNPYTQIAELKAKLAEVMPLAKFAALLIEDVVWYPDWCAIEAGVINADGKGYAPNIKATITKLLKD